VARRLTMTVLIGVVLALAAGGLPAGAREKSATVTRPSFSAVPVAGVTFTATGAVRPQATRTSRTVVKVTLSALEDGSWRMLTTGRAVLSATAGGTGYSRQLTVPSEGRYSVRAYHYRAGKLVAKSRATTFDVARRVTVDSNVNGWLAPAAATTEVPSGTPLDVVFTTPSDWSSGAAEKVNGAAHFIWGDFTKVDTDGLIWHTEGLAPGRYDWMRDSMPKWGTGALVAAQRIAVDKVSHADTHALANLPAEISFGDVSDAGMGCDRSIAFLTRVFTQTSADPLVWHTGGLPAGGYDWKCWMDDCHYGKLVVDDGADVAIDSDPLDSRTVVAAGTPLDLVFSGARMMCWRTIHFTGATGDLTKTVSYTAGDPHVTWHTAGLAPGEYEWECWMGPQCHHGTIVVE
jgi:hypothetical protein